MQVINVISYAPFWDTLRRSDETTYTLINRHHLSSSTIDKLRKNKPLNTTTINDLCRILRCPVEQIMIYIPSETDQIL
jgi:DNA-binding Xre family transcriptional regulator